MTGEAFEGTNVSLFTLIPFGGTAESCAQFPSKCMVGRGALMALKTVQRASAEPARMAQAERNDQAKRQIVQGRRPDDGRT